MNLGFWENLPRPFWALAPMEDVTDIAFRQMFARHGRYKDPKSSSDDRASADGNLRGPDVLWTEFTSADGLLKGGWERLKHQLFYEENERPIVVQLFSAHPDRMMQAAKLCVELGFDGIDINMGCPSSTVVSNGCGCDLIRNPELAQDLIRAAKEGAGEVPVSVKTRTGFNESQIEDWVPQLLSAKPAVLIMHGRTRKQMSKVPNDWDEIARVVEIRDQLESETLIVGNGDITSLEQGENRAQETGVEGIMVGRGAFGNPWFFNPNINYDDLSAEDRLGVMVEHARTFDELLPNQHFAIMRKHFKAYTSGLPASNELRDELMEADDSEEVADIVERYLSSN
ncbi:MAG: tRNA-dihydrouridine synthase [Candidatus Paceibacterota bacterium]